MAKITSHTLDGFSGNHAAGIEVFLLDTKTGLRIFAAKMDDGGRLAEEVVSEDINPNTVYELVFKTGAYWAALGIQSRLSEIVLRFQMEDPNRSYHMPIIINPHSYSTWISH
jgi:5-hydroxyisourate hydrolase